MSASAIRFRRQSWLEIRFRIGKLGQLIDRLGTLLGAGCHGAGSHLPESGERSQAPRVRGLDPTDGSGQNRRNSAMESCRRRKNPTKRRDIAVGKRGDERAPHQPLLILWNLGRVQRGGHMVLFRDAGPGCAGCRKNSVLRGNPFTRSVLSTPHSDGLWEVIKEKSARRRRGKSQRKRISWIWEFRADFRPRSTSCKHHPALRSVTLASVRGTFQVSPVGSYEQWARAPWSGARQEGAPFRQQALDACGHACSLGGFSVRAERAVWRRARHSPASVRAGPMPWTMAWPSAPHITRRWTAARRLRMKSSAFWRQVRWKGSAAWRNGSSARRAAGRASRSGPGEACGGAPARRQECFGGSANPPMHQSASAQSASVSNRFSAAASKASTA